MGTNNKGSKELKNIVNDLVDGITSLNKNVDELPAKISKIIPAMAQVVSMNEKMSKVIAEKITLEKNANDAESAATMKKAKQTQELMAIYQKNRDALKKQHNEKIAELETSYNAEIKLSESSAEKVKKIEDEKKQHIALLNNKLKTDLENNTKALLDATSAMMDKSVSDILKKSEKAKVHGKEVTKANVAEIQKQAEQAADAVNKSTDAVAKKAEDVKYTGGAFWKGVVDVEATKKNVAAVKEELEEYQKTLEASKKATLEYYQQQLLKPQTPDEWARLIEERKALLTKYAEEEVKIKNALTENDKRDNDLRLKQLQGYANNAKQIFADINTNTTELFNGIKEMSRTWGDSLKSDITSLTNEMTAATAERAELNQKEDDAITELNKKKEQHANGEIQLTTEQLNQIETDLNTHNSNKVKIKEDFDKKDEELKKKKEKKEKTQKVIAKIQQKTELAQQIVKAVADVSAGVAKTLALGWPLGTIMAPLIATAGAIQIGIMSKNLAKFEQGGLLRGRRHRDGGMRIEGTNIEVEGGEYVINRRSTAKNLGLLEYINASDRALQPAELMTAMDSPTAMTGQMKYHLEDGGQVPAVETAAQNNNEQLLDAIRQIKIDSRVAVTDIMNAQDNYAKIEKWVGF